jgi:hypothetical protein
MHPEISEGSTGRGAVYWLQTWGAALGFGNVRFATVIWSLTGSPSATRHARLTGRPNLALCG